MPCSAETDGRRVGSAPRLQRRNPWPFVELSADQRHEVARFEARMRAGQLPGLPSVFGPPVRFATQVVAGTVRPGAAKP